MIGRGANPRPLLDVHHAMFFVSLKTDQAVLKHLGDDGLFWNAHILVNSHPDTLRYSVGGHFHGPQDRCRSRRERATAPAQATCAHVP